MPKLKNVQTRDVRAGSFGGLDSQVPNTPPVWVTPAGRLLITREGSLVSFALNATDDVSAPSYSVASGSLPPGLSLTPSGLISGTVGNIASDRTFFFVARATDAGSLSAQRAFNIVVGALNDAPIWITDSDLGTFNERTLVNVPINVFDDDGDVDSLLLVDGDLPSGLIYDVTNRRIFGTPDDVNTLTTTSFVLQAADPSGLESIRTFTISVRNLNRPPVITTPVSENGFLFSVGQGKSFTLPLLASDDDATLPLSWDVTSGSLPEGLTMSAAGIISGTTPATIDADITYTFVARVTDAAGAFDSATFIGEYVRPNAPPVWVTSTNLGTFAEQQSFVIPVTATDDFGPVAYSEVAPNRTGLYDRFGSLVRFSGGTLRGVINQVPLEGRNFSFIARATDVRGLFVDRTFVVNLTNVNRAPVWSTPSGQLGDVQGGGDSYEFLYRAFDDENAPLNYTLVAGELPPGLSLGTTTNLWGGSIPALIGVIPAQETSRIYSFTIGAVDSMGLSTPRDFSIRVRAGAAPSNGQGTTVVPVWNSTTLGPFPELSTIVATLDASDALGRAISFYLPAQYIPPFEFTQSGDIITGQLGRLAGVGPGETGTLPLRMVAYNGLRGTEATLSVIVQGAPSDPPTWVTPTFLQPVAEGEEFSISLNADDDEVQVTYSFVSGALPDFASLAPNGVITGRAPGTVVNRTWTFTVRATDSDEQSVDQSFVFTLLNSSDGPAWVSSGTLATLTGLGGGSIALRAIGARADKYSIVAGEFPAFASITERGAIVGVAPDVASPTVYTFTVQARSAVDETSDQELAIAVVPRVNTAPEIFTAAGLIGDTIAGRNFRFDFSGRDDAPSLQWALESGSLPVGLSLNAAGILSGFVAPISTPSETFTFAVSATDIDNVSSTLSPVSIRVRRPDTAPVWITPGGVLATFISGAAFQATLTASDDHGPLSYILRDSTSLFPIFSLNSSGVVSGVMPFIPVDGSAIADFVVAASDGVRETPRRFQIVGSVDPANAGQSTLPPSWITASNLGIFDELTTLNVAIRASGVSPLVYAISSGVLPAAVSLTEEGTLSGELPAVSVDQVFEFTARVDTGNGLFAEQSFSFTVRDTNEPPLWLSPPAGSLGSFTALTTLTGITLTATDDAGIVAYSIASGSLPSGLILDGRVLRGTFAQVPISTNGGTLEASFTVRARDIENEESLRAFSMTVLRANEPPTWTTPSGNVGTFDEGQVITAFTLTAADDVGVSRYSIVTGQLPAGLTLNSTSGVVTGSLALIAVDEFRTFAVQAVDAGGLSATRSFDITVRDVPTWQTPSFLNAFNQNTTISIQLVASNTTDYSVVGGALPPGILLSPSGLLHGVTPAASVVATTYSWTVRAMSALGAASTRTFQLQVSDNPPFWVTTEGTSLGTYQGGQTVSQQLVADDSNGDIVNYEVTVGTLPSGLVLNSLSGLVSGSLAMPETTATSSFRVRVTDAAGAAAEVGLNITVQKVITTVEWQTPNGTVVDDGVGAEAFVPMSAIVTQQVV